MASQRTFTLNFVGDCMLGRLIDQLFPQHVHNPEEARIAHSFLRTRDNLETYKPATPWGNTLPLLHEADFTLVNLETAVTNHSTKWPNKVFNHRMHPANIAALQAAQVDYAGLANNHTLDFCDEGLLETVQTVKAAGVAFAGAGETSEEATRPAILKLTGRKKEHDVHVWAAADHPGDWAKVPMFHFIDYSQQTKDRLKQLLNDPSSGRAALKVFSVHWGPNYSWQPAQEIQSMAHFLTDECGIDVIHGHSSHHVQGVEKYHGKLIIYGCGDFVDDYALVPEYRNDLSGIWRVSIEESEDGETLRLRSLEMYPTKIESFTARRLYSYEKDSQWVRQRVKMLSQELGTHAEFEHEGEGRLTVDST